MRARWGTLAAAGLLAVLAAGCVSTQPSESLAVRAPGSLRGALDDVARQFEDAHRGIAITIRYDGHPGAMEQLGTALDQPRTADEAIDVLITEDESLMWQAVDEGLVSGDPVTLARSTYVVAIPSGADSTFDDVVSSAMAVSTCSEELPCGQAAHAVARRAGLAIDTDLQEQTPSEVLERVIDGSAEAGLVLDTATHAAGQDVTILDLPFPASTTSLAAPVAESPDRAAAQRFIEFLRTDEAQDALDHSGLAAR
ncbi:substrate-binding domain-containing protein [Hoyosella sp. G463]|uniref:Substrate-binding domain-containing protein n=1 Tax=Lolliginicoccus lacisalsi TaxID=2742202 RepID=A0A927JAW5_9ACTN|nr:substrate-binding domain-containing protein [Lolliginicoccus lacisalsi]MBD8505901.1 substrate-binding domain-containing protein [Lolliginicoccus lacisalsi]